jgi:protein-tyrosine-phosphatase
MISGMVPKPPRRDRGSRDTPPAGGAPSSPTDSTGEDRATFNILFICTGNTCRSPMAEVIARDEIARRGWAHVRVASAGVAAGSPSAASEHAVAVARLNGLDLSTHRSRQLTEEMLDWADLVLTMSPSHLASLSRSRAADRAAVLGDFSGRPGGVSDPYGGPVEVYEDTFRELRELISGALDRLAPILHP